MIGLPARLVQLAGPVEVVARRRGVEAAVAVARRHRGTQFDPAVVDLFCSRAPDLLDGLDRASDWDAILGTEPQLSRRVAGADLDQVLDAMADLVDLKSPYLAGHSRGGWPAWPPRPHKPAANHVEHIYAKLGVSSRAAATLYATQHGLMGAFESAT